MREKKNSLSFLTQSVLNSGFVRSWCSVSVCVCRYIKERLCDVYSHSTKSSTLLAPSSQRLSTLPLLPIFLSRPSVRPSRLFFFFPFLPILFVVVVDVDKSQQCVSSPRRLTSSSPVEIVLRNSMQQSQFLIPEYIEPCLTDEGKTPAVLLDNWKSMIRGCRRLEISGLDHLHFLIDF